jgi:hypothetical protein
MLTIVSEGLSHAFHWQPQLAAIGPTQLGVTAFSITKVSKIMSRSSQAGSRSRGTGRSELANAVPTSSQWAYTPHPPTLRPGLFSLRVLCCAAMATHTLTPAPIAASDCRAPEHGSCCRSARPAPLAPCPGSGSWWRSCSTSAGAISPRRRWIRSWRSSCPIEGAGGGLRVSPFRRPLAALRSDRLRWFHPALRPGGRAHPAEPDLWMGPSPPRRRGR